MNIIEETIDEIEQELKSLINDFKSSCKKQPYIAIVNTNPDDEPSQRYIRNKVKKCADNGIRTSVHNIKNMEELRDLLSRLNRNEDVTSIIIQYPFAKWVNVPDQEIFDLVNKEKDIDRLHSCWYYNSSPTNLPLTSQSILEILVRLQEKGILKEKDNILFHGNGITTNRRLFLYLFNEGLFDCRIINSKTPKKSVKELTHWSHLIVSGVGKKDTLDCEGKLVICPSIIKNEDGTFSSDLIDSKRNKNITHKVIGSIGKLTTNMLILQAYADAYNI